MVTKNPIKFDRQKDNELLQLRKKHLVEEADE